MSVAATRGATAKVATDLYSGAAVPVLLYGVALVARIAALQLISFPLNEGGAYYVAAAQNLATGRGLVVDAIWSYATPPLVLPRPAFELWQPLASLIAAAPMLVLPSTFATAQLAFALLGALLAPLAWLVARDAALHLHLHGSRATLVALSSGLLVGIAGPFVMAAALPDSTLPFTVLAVAACVVMPRAVGGDRRAIVALGVLAGLTYLARMEAVYLVFAFVLVGLSVRVGWRTLLPRGLAIAATAALVALPWWLRNLSVFGTALPGQLSDNLLLTRNEQIFAYGARPSVAEFLGQGPLTIVGNVGVAIWHDLVDVLLVPGVAVAVVGFVTLLIGFRRRREIAGTQLLALLTLGLATFALTSVLFPVATLWGTFDHAAGPLLVGLAVLAALGADALVAALRNWRHWPRSNAWLAPAALLALAVPLTALQITLASTYARERATQLTAVAAAVGQALPGTADAPLITDHPLWLADQTGRSTLVLPDGPPDEVLLLAHRFGAAAVVLIDNVRSGYPASLSTGAAAACFIEQPVAPSSDAPNLAIFSIAEACK